MSDQARQEFDAWISSQLRFEHPISRYPQDPRWPGCYRDHCVQLAWEAWQEAWNRRAYDEGPTADIPAEQNQCDGCKQGLRVINGLHRTDDDKAFMACTAHLYR